MTSTAADFLATIIAAPDDDTPRLVFADFLEENGEPERGEFIRVQCELARHIHSLSTGPPSTASEWSSKAEALRSRERELLELHGQSWIAEMFGNAKIAGLDESH